jgi:hypothetical protein
MTILLSFLSRYGIQIIGGLAVMAVLAWGYSAIYGKGYAAAEGEYKEILALRDAADRDAHDKAKADADRIGMLLGQVSTDAALIAAQKARKREVEFRDVIKWRTKYAQNPDAGECAIPAEFVRVLDAAGQDSGGVSATATGGTGTDAGTGRISDIELLQYSTDVKMMCLRWRDKLIWWQERERALVAAQG